MSTPDENQPKSDTEHLLDAAREEGEQTDERRTGGRVAETASGTGSASDTEMNEADFMRLKELNPDDFE
ncbi:hypothetical protein [Streptosporangium pseudovulgare]|uniref:Uncharacterized protein n=1 Tax=Streptosporangium pseudovulgare TaxID=35765 RepID=A0ABQ2RIJ2_9ACTN|nr:hypothetical protein [Streptosporangium pseudovulgare]GGQ33960.1 hypothetical protein GCM10010140_74950 [Streptosporangium pseudovulgare]